MKTTKLLIVIITHLVTLSVMAEDVLIDGINYSIVTKAKVAQVIPLVNERYSGDIVIPAVIQVDGVEYSVTSIGDYAFRYCGQLTSVSIPFSVTSIGEEAFTGSFMNKAEFASIECLCKMQFDGYYSNPLSMAHDLYISGEEMKNVTIPTSVTDINNYAFAGCSELESVTISSSVTSIGECAFSGCTKLINIVIPNGVTLIKRETFSKCTNLSSVTLPASVKSIESYAFLNCSNLTEFSVPSAVVSIGYGAFSGCTGLKSVSLPESLFEIGISAFLGCTGLTSIAIPSSVMWIYDYAFKDCNQLASVTIPSSVTEIRREAFSGCSGIADLYCYAEQVPFLHSDVFADAYIEYSTLHVPSSAIESYRDDSQWGMFGTIVAIDNIPEVKQCAKPTISYKEGKLTFSCETEGAEFVSEVLSEDFKKSYTAEVNLTITYIISVYAICEGYKQSETATATLCWIDATPTGEGFTDGVEAAEIKAVPVLVQADGGGLSIVGAESGTPVQAYDLSGKLLSTTTAVEGTTYMSLAADTKLVILRIGSKSMKVMVK